MYSINCMVLDIQDDNTRVGSLVSQQVRICRKRRRGGVSEVTGLTGKRGAFVVYDFWRICCGPTSEMGRGEWRGDGGERDEVA